MYPVLLYTKPAQEKSVFVQPSHSIRTSATHENKAKDGRKSIHNPGYISNQPAENAK
jgi:hypothetical protein